MQNIFTIHSILLWGLLYIKSFSAIFIFDERENFQSLVKFEKSFSLHRCFIYRKM